MFCGPTIGCGGARTVFGGGGFIPNGSEGPPTPLGVGG